MSPTSRTAKNLAGSIVTGIRKNLPIIILTGFENLSGFHLQTIWQPKPLPEQRSVSKAEGSAIGLLSKIQ
jgi:hypothetical protein